ncbi:MAG: MBL fold metallo-hydrolase [Spirochaetes bacterium]|nr:MBL fold metallo-hydrolase [Spirochaetota bacterium]
MGELVPVHLTGGTWLLPGPTNLGLVRKEDEAWLVDSGNDKDAGRKVLKLLAAEGLRLKAVLNTHSNADHIGANAYLQGQTSCEVWAPAFEAPFIENPALEGSLLWGGFPFGELRSKFFEAKSSKVTRPMAPGEMAEGFEFIPLPGHFIQMSGIRTGDGVLFLGDAAFGPLVLEKHKIPFLYDIRAFRESLDRILSTEASWYVPSHGEPCRDPEELVEANAAKVDAVEAAILGILSRPVSFEEALATLCVGFGFDLDLSRYALIGSTLRSFLSYLNGEGKIGYRFEGGRMLWETRDCPGPQAGTRP